MISVKQEFKVLDRGYKETIALIPGWASDYRIFDNLELDYNYLFPTRFNPLTFSDELLMFIDRKSIKKISLFGWSLGGFLAVEFSLSNPERVNQVNLLSIREKYEQAVLAEVRRQVEKNKSAYLYKFFINCFSDSDRTGLAWLKGHLLKEYIHMYKLEDLLRGLDYLETAEISAQDLALLKNVRIFHGLDDFIAPLNEIKEFKIKLPGLKLIYLQNAGHIPFLTPGFKDHFINE